MNWGWADGEAVVEDDRPASRSPRRPGSSLRPGSRGGAGKGERSADAATAAAAALLEKQQLEQAQRVLQAQRRQDAARDDFPEVEREEAEGGNAIGRSGEHAGEGGGDRDATHEHRRTARDELDGRGATTSQRDPQRQQQYQKQQRKELDVSRQAQSSREPREPLSEPRSREDPQRKNQRGQEQEGGMLKRAARIMAEDNDLDTKTNGDVPGNHSAMPMSKTDGVASEAIARITLEERPRFSLIDQVVGEFVQGFVELERRLHLSRAHTDRDFLSRLAETQTRLLVEGDLGFGSGGPDPNATLNSVDDGSDGTDGVIRQQQQKLAAHAQFERDERLVTQLELHHGEISELMWSALATKGEVQRRGARELMDHAVTELRSCLERQEEEFKAHSAWLRATCDRKIGAARAAGDTAHAQATREAESRFAYRLKLLRRHHADEILGQENQLAQDYKDALEKREFFENKFRALERAQEGYMAKITSSEERAIRAEADSKKNADIARKATRKARTQETELQVTAAACAKAERQNAKLKRIRETLNEKLTKSEQRVIALEGDLSIRGAKIIALEEAIAEQNVNTSGVAERVKAEKERQRLREIEMETMKMDLQHAKAQASRASSIVSRQTDVIEKLRSDLRDMESENDHLSSECTEREQHVHELEEQCAAGRREVDQMRHRLMESSKHSRRMSVQLNEKLSQAYAAVRNVVENVTAPPPDFDPSSIPSQSLMQQSQTAEGGDGGGGSTLAGDDSGAGGEWTAVKEGDSLVTPAAAAQSSSSTLGDQSSGLEAVKDRSNAIDPAFDQDAVVEDAKAQHGESEEETKETETEAVPEEPARQRTYEEIMWDRGAAEREAVAAAKRAEEEAAAAAKKQQEEEDAMMEALLANAAKAEKAEKRAKRNAKRGKKSKKSGKKKKKKSGGSSTGDSNSFSGSMDGRSVFTGSSSGSSMYVGGGSSRPSSGASGSRAKWKVLRSKAAEAMDHLRVHVAEAEKSKHQSAASPSGGGSGNAAAESHAAMERKLELELRESIEIELRRKVQREFEKKLVGGLRARLAREIERKAKIAFKKRIDAELAKIKLTPDETRDALEEERKVTKNLEGEVEDLASEIKRLREEAGEKDKGSAELALLVREKDMLLTEMTLLVRAYKDELKTEKANLQSVQMLAGRVSNRDRRGDSSSSRPHSSKPASLASSRSSRPQSRQRPHTANAVMGRDNNGHNGGRLDDGIGFSAAADEARREWEEEREREESERMYAMKQRATAPMNLSASRERVVKMTGASAQSRIEIPGSAKRRRQQEAAQKRHGRPTTAPLQRSGKLKGKGVKKQKKRRGKQDQQQRQHQHQQEQQRYYQDQASMGRQALQQSLASKMHRPYVPAALIRTSLRDGFVHSDSSDGRGLMGGPDGIAIPEPLSTAAQLRGSQSQPALSSGQSRPRPKSSPFIRFGSTGIQELLERKRRSKK